MNKTLLTYWRSHLLPSPAALALVSIAGAFIGLGLACGTLYSASSRQTASDGVGRFGLRLWCDHHALAALLLLGAAAAKRHLPRGLVISVAALTVLLGGLDRMGIASDTGSPFVVETQPFFFFMPLAILLFGVALYFTAKELARNSATIIADRERRAIQMIEARGETTLASAAAELGLRLEECDDVVEAALQAGTSTVGTMPRAGACTAPLPCASGKPPRRHRPGRGQSGWRIARRLNASIWRAWIYELVKRANYRLH
jgi:hypothetical protein